MTDAAARPDPIRWCVVHDAQEVDDSVPFYPHVCWKRYIRPVAYGEACEILEGDVEAVSEMGRLDASDPVPEGWYVLFATDDFQMITKVVTWRRVVPALPHEREAMQAATDG